MGFTPTVLAAENTLPGSGYWTDVAGLSGFNMTSSGATIGKIKFGLDGGDSRIWAIAGVDANDNNALSLLAITTFGMDDGLSPYPTAPYAATEFVMNMDNYLSASFFSTGEKAVINPVTVKSWEFAGWDDQASQPLYAEISKYIAEPQGLEKNEYEFYIKALRPKETCWLGPMIMLKRSDGDICIRYSIKSNKSDGNLSGEIKFSVV